ncbi:penicillin-binding protein [Alloscardovia theropitheci]|uniref:Penicillin-binding protein n=1 Tax=Alloscardovia theropitheci TaxID=2496842 RepID=A0A4R0QQE3_9BIFI|nr:transglycosylase domain-containing protein [Alloscardovia theropitheci]TCD54532.1 penicillin-binding protein [Alloscardovia theropitheci]
MATHKNNAGSTSARSARSSRTSTSHARSAQGNSTHGTSGSRRPRNSRGPRRSHSSMKKRPIIKYILLSILGLFVIGVAGLGIAYATTEIPSPESVALSQKTTVYYNDGTTAIGSFQEENREIIGCSALPDYVGNAVVASENRSFWSDSGIDLRGIARALFTNITTGTRQGGSTITQQYAERYYLGETKSYIGKLREALLALKIAQTQDKSTVLCNYMNTIYFGRGAYGIQAAAKAYFNKDAKDLTPSEAALIAGIIPAPSIWDPAVDNVAATKRFNRVIKIMKEDGYLTSEQAASAQLPQTIEQASTDQYAGDKGYLLSMVKSELLNTDQFTEDQLMTGGYSIITSIDKDKQAYMQQVGAGDGSTPETVETGGMSADVDTGEIIAVYGGKDYNTKQLNNATQAIYQAGSTMKTFTLIGAIQQDVSLNTLFNGNSPRTYQGLGKSVSNYGNISYGNITLTRALARSVNTVFVDLNQKVTPEKTAQIAKSAGISSSIQTDSLYNTLGIDAIHVSEIVQAYQTIAHDGVRNDLHIVREVRSDQGTNTVYTANTQGTQVFSSNVTANAQTALRAVITEGYGTPALAVGKTVAGKSGTANDNSAVSFAGFSRHVVTAFATWNPSDDGKTNEPVPTFGGYTDGMGYPTHLFTLYMKQALAGVQDEAFPTPKSTGIVGGPDGSWGLGGQRTQTQNDEEEESSDDDSASESNRRNQNQEQQNQQQQNSTDSNSSGNSDSSSSSGSSSESGNSGQNSQANNENSSSQPQSGEQTTGGN